MLYLISKYGYALVNMIEYKDNVAIVRNNQNIEYIVKLFNDGDSFTNESYYYELASKHNIAPKIITHPKDLIIISEKMNTLVDQDRKLINKNIIAKEFIQCLDTKINLMHNLGFAHGDLSIYNIVYNDNDEPFIIDFEKSYEINDRNWSTELWMRKGFNWEDSYENFVNYEYSLWKEQLQMSTQSSFKTSVNEDYYSVRFIINNYDICCCSFAKCLQSKLGGTIYGISETREGSVPCHYVLLTDKFIDCTGIYTDEESMLKMVKSRYDNELDYDLICYKVDQDTLNNKDYECDMTDPEIVEAIEYIINAYNF